MDSDVVLDVTCLARATLTGVGNYTLNLARALEALGQVPTYAHKGSRLGASAKIKRWLPTGSRPYFPGLSDLFLRDKKVFHGPDFRLIASRCWKRVVTLHDLAIYNPRFTASDFATFAHGQFLATINSEPDRVVLSSQYCADELVARFPQVGGRIRVVGLGSDRLLGITPKPIPVSEPYFLFVGTIEARKNVTGLVKAFTKFLKDYPRFRLICVGGEGFDAESALTVMEPLISDGNIHRVGFVDDSVLVYLYQNAAGLVYPSFYEGFGLPILEAMSLECPVITSKCGSMSEVSGGNALLVDPHNTSALADAMCAFAKARPLEMIARAKIHAQGHTWTHTAKKMLEIYQSWDV